MEYKRKLFTMPTDLVERLEKEENQSKVVAKALKNYYTSKDDFGSLTEQFSIIQSQLDEIKQFAQGRY